VKKVGVATLFLVLFAFVGFWLYQRTVFWAWGAVIDGEVRSHNISNNHINEETLIVFFDGRTSSWGDLTSALTTRGAHQRVESWLERNIESENVRIGSLSEVTGSREATIIGRQGLRGRVVTDILIYYPVPPEPVEAASVKFLGVAGARREWEEWGQTYLYFPHTSFDLEQLSADLLLDWSLSHQAIFDYFATVRLKLTNGHQLKLYPHLIEYIIDGQFRYFSREEKGKVIWVDGDNWEVTTSPFERY